MLRLFVNFATLQQHRRSLKHSAWAGLLATIISLLSACSMAPGAGLTPAVSPADAARIRNVSQLYQPSEQLAELFVDVQLAPLFDDSKTFVDSRILAAPAEVLNSYRALERRQTPQLREFVASHFAAPAPPAGGFSADATRELEVHLREHWSYLTRDADRAQEGSTLIALPYPYVVPGGRFREIYYWDSYFTMHGLLVSGHRELALNMLKNFAWLIDQWGHIPNGNRSYYLSRSQPPFFGAMVRLYQQHAGADAAADFLPALIKEHQFWMHGAGQLQPGEAKRRVVRLNDGALLNRYYDDKAEPRPESYREDVKTAASSPLQARPRIYRDIRAAAESGWDFSSRWLSDESALPSIETTNIVAVDLNSLLYELESLISELSAAVGNKPQMNAFAEKARARKYAIDTWLWNAERGLYSDYHLRDGRFTGVDSLAMVYPLYFGAASSAQAASVANVLSEHFLMAGGLVTTLNHTGEQWDYPNGWAPLQWLAVNGLAEYGHTTLSREIAKRWLNLNRKVFATTGRMMEKYNVVDVSLPAGGGEYPLQDGFGWTNGVALKLMEMLSEGGVSD